MLKDDSQLVLRPGQRHPLLGFMGQGDVRHLLDPSGQLLIRHSMRCASKPGFIIGKQSHRAGLTGMLLLARQRHGPVPALLLYRRQKVVGP